MADAALSIGQLAQSAGIHVQTLRYYEAQGLLAPSGRTAGGQRRYGAQAAQRLHFIRHAREFGFSTEQIRELLDLAGESSRSCEEVDAIVRRQRELVRRRIDLLQQLEGELDRMLSECSGGRVTECRVLEALGDHGRCASAHGHAQADDDPPAR
ncbi:MAG: helix-turn-helix domain-containing protein [Halofilum sp. (in: g-proteobacteria)]